jgi:integrase
LVIRGTVSLGEIQDTTKTPAGVREVDLCANLNSYLGETLAFSDFGKEDLMFPSSIGGVACQRTIYNHLKKTGIERTFHSFRRYRVTYLRKNRVPDDLIQFWTGHAKKTVTDDYSKLAEDLELRRYWCEKVGLGFDL